MQISKADKVVILKDVESNIIQEAFVVLKKNIKFDIEDKIKNNTLNLNKEDCILKEAENIINNKINEGTLNYDKFKVQKLEKKLKIQKKLNLFLIITIISLIIIK